MGGVPAPELEVHVLDRDLAGKGRVKTAIETTNSLALMAATRPRHSQPDESSPSAAEQLSSGLWRSNSLCCAIIILSSPNWNDDTDEMDGFSTIRALLGDSWRSTFLNGGVFALLDANTSIKEKRERRRTWPPPSIYTLSSAHTREQRYQHIQIS